MTPVIFIKPNRAEISTRYPEAPVVGDFVVLLDEPRDKFWRVIRRTWEDGRCYLHIGEIDTGYDARNRPTA